MQNFWSVSAYFKSDHVQSHPTDMFVLFENYNYDTQLYSVRKFYIANGAIQSLNYDCVASKIDADFRLKIFGELNYSKHCKPRYYAVTRHTPTNSMNNFIAKVTKNSTELNSDLCKGLESFLVVGSSFKISWNVASKINNEITPYDLILFNSGGERGRNRSQSLEVENECEVIWHQKLANQSEDTTSPVDQVSLLFLQIMHN